MSDLTPEEIEEGTIAALLERLTHRRLPNLLALKEQLERGESLQELQLEFLERVLHDANLSEEFWERHPELQEIAAKMVDLYHDITELALAVEEAELAKGGPRGTSNS